MRIIKQDFGLTIDIEELIDTVDSDGSGEIEFDEFKTLLSSSSSGSGKGKKASSDGNAPLGAGGVPPGSGDAGQTGTTTA